MGLIHYTKHVSIYTHTQKLPEGTKMLVSLTVIIISQSANFQIITSYILHVHNFVNYTLIKMKFNFFTEQILFCSFKFLLGKHTQLCSRLTLESMLRNFSWHCQGEQICTGNPSQNVFLQRKLHAHYTISLDLNFFISSLVILVLLG